VARVLRMPEVADDPTAATLTAWLVDEAADFGGAQSIATVETASSLLSIEVSEPGVLIKSLVAPGQEVLPGSPLAVLGAPGEVVDDVELLMAQLGLALAAGTADPDVHLRAVPHDALRATAWLPHEPAESAEPMADADPLATGSDLPPAAVLSVAPLIEAVSEPILAVTAEEAAVQEAAVQEAAVQEAAVQEAAVQEAAVQEAADDSAAPSTPAPTSELPRPTSSVRQIRLREQVRADALVTVVNTVEAVSLTALIVKAVAMTTRRVPLLPATSSVTDVAVQRWTEAGTIAPVVHVAGLMTATSVSTTLRGLDARLRDGRVTSGELQPATVTVVDLGTFRVGEASLDASVDNPAILAVGGVSEQAVIEDGAVVPGRAMTVTLSCDADRIEASTAALWLTHLARVLEQPLHFLT
jgi:pyruvate dehydrogenase E2 component (dihydrolipoamide acetyltransferase)